MKALEKTGEPAAYRMHHHYLRIIDLLRLLMGGQNEIAAAIGYSDSHISDLKKPNSALKPGVIMMFEKLVEEQVLLALRDGTFFEKVSGNKANIIQANRSESELRAMMREEIEALDKIKHARSINMEVLQDDYTRPADWNAKRDQ